MCQAIFPCTPIYTKKIELTNTHAPIEAVDELFYCVDLMRSIAATLVKVKSNYSSTNFQKILIGFFASKIRGIVEKVLNLRAKN